MSDPRVERPEREAEHSPPSNAEVNNVWVFTSTPPYIPMTWCLSTGAKIYVEKAYENLQYSFCIKIWMSYWKIFSYNLEATYRRHCVYTL